MPTAMVYATSSRVAGCTDASACNYNADATDDDGSCDFADAGYDGVCDDAVFDLQDVPMQCGCY